MKLILEIVFVHNLYILQRRRFLEGTYVLKFRMQMQNLNRKWHNIYIQSRPINRYATRLRKP